MRPKIGNLDRSSTIELGQPHDSECLLPSLEVSTREVDGMSMHCE